MEKKNMPEIRFKGFSGDWERKRFSEFIELRNESGNQKNYSVDIELENLVTDVGTVVGDTSIRTQSTSIFRRDDTLFGRLRPYLNKWWMAECDGVKSGEIWALKNTEISKNVFVHSAVQTKIFLESANVSSGTKMPRADWNKVANDTMRIPFIAEQTAIGNFFRNLDELITLHQCKHDKLVIVKKAMLDKMFPKDGESVPEVRFAGFSGDWEEKKLGEIADIVGGGTPSTSIEEYWNGNVDWYAPAEINEQIFVNSSQKKITELGLQKSSATVLPVGTVLFTSRAGIGKAAILAKNAATNQGFQSIVPHKNELNSYFIFSRTHELKRYAETVGAGSTFVEVSGKQMNVMPILMPPLTEQTAIGNFFRNLDNLITGHQQELEKLKTIKKSMLEKMFI